MFTSLNGRFSSKWKIFVKCASKKDLPYIHLFYTLDMTLYLCCSQPMWNQKSLLRIKKCPFCTNRRSNKWLIYLLKCLFDYFRFTSKVRKLKLRRISLNLHEVHHGMLTDRVHGCFYYLLILQNNLKITWCSYNIS